MASPLPDIIKLLFQKTRALPATEIALLKTITAVLTAGDMALWISAGRKILAQSWNISTTECREGFSNYAFAIKLHGALADPELGWGGWKIIGMPGVLKMISYTSAGMTASSKLTTQSLLDDEPRLFGYFLARLVKETMLEIGDADTDKIWKDGIGRWVKRRLDGWRMDGEESVRFPILLFFVSNVYIGPGSGCSFDACALFIPRPNSSNIKSSC